MPARPISARPALALTALGLVGLTLAFVRPGPGISVRIGRVGEAVEDPVGGGVTIRVGGSIDSDARAYTAVDRVAFEVYSIDDAGRAIRTMTFAAEYDPATSTFLSPALPAEYDPATSTFLGPVLDDGVAPGRPAYLLLDVVDTADRHHRGDGPRPDFARNAVPIPSPGAAGSR